MEAKKYTKEKLFLSHVEKYTTKYTQDFTIIYKCPYVASDESISLLFFLFIFKNDNKFVNLYFLKFTHIHHIISLTKINNFFLQIHYIYLNPNNLTFFTFFFVKLLKNSLNSHRSPFEYKQIIKDKSRIKDKNITNHQKSKVYNTSITIILILTILLF